MLVEMEAQLSLLGLTSRLAVAPTWGAAWALARYGPVRTICTAKDIRFKLGPLPVTGLRLDSETVLLMRRLGLKTIGDVMEVPRLSLTRRFVKADLPSNPLLRLDQALGKLAEPVASHDAPPKFRAESRLAEPIFDPVPHLPRLCSDLCDKLKKAGMGCRRLRLTVYRTDGDISYVQLVTSVPTNDPDHLRSLFREKVEKINPGFGFDLLTLDANRVEAMQDVQNTLDGGADDDLHLGQLIDRLTARFGTQAVVRPKMRESHVPERAIYEVSALADCDAVSDPVTKDRPIRLLHHPEEVRVLYAVPEGPPAQFVWRRQTLRVIRFAGPERIAPEWWHDRPGTRLRDYFKVEDQTGRRIWLYREGMHGDGRGGDPRWFVHGMFA